MFNLRPRGHDLSLPSVKKVLFRILSLWELSLSTNSLFLFFSLNMIDIITVQYLLFVPFYCVCYVDYFDCFSCSCNSVRMTLNSIKGNLLTYLQMKIFKSWSSNSTDRHRDTHTGIRDRTHYHAVFAWQTCALLTHYGPRNDNPFASCDIIVCIIMVVEKSEGL